MLALDLTKFVDGLSEPDRVHLAQKIMKGLPIEKRALLFEGELSDSGLVVTMNGSNPFFHDAQDIASLALPNQDIAGSVIPNLYRQIQSNTVDLAAVIEAVVMARRQK